MEVMTVHLPETGDRLLAKVGNLGSIIVCECLVAKDGVGDLRYMDQVQFEQTGQVSLFRLVRASSKNDVAD